MTKEEKIASARQAGIEYNKKELEKQLGYIKEQWESVEAAMKVNKVEANNPDNKKYVELWKKRYNTAKRCKDANEVKALRKQWAKDDRTAKLSKISEKMPWNKKATESFVNWCDSMTIADEGALGDAIISKEISKIEKDLKIYTDEKKGLTSDLDKQIIDVRIKVTKDLLNKARKSNSLKELRQIKSQYRSEMKSRVNDIKKKYDEASLGK